MNQYPWLYNNYSNLPQKPKNSLSPLHIVYHECALPTSRVIHNHPEIDSQAGEFFPGKRNINHVPPRLSVRPINFSGTLKRLETEQPNLISYRSIHRGTRSRTELEKRSRRKGPCHASTWLFSGAHVTWVVHKRNVPGRVSEDLSSGSFAFDSTRIDTAWNSSCHAALHYLLVNGAW